MPKISPRLIVSLTLLIAAIWLLPLLFAPEPAPPAAPASDFAFTDSHGKKGKLSDFKGKPVLLHFWASWCVPCVEEFPQLVTLAKNHPDLTIVALSADGTRKKMTEFLEKHKLPKNLKAVWDKDRAISFDLYQTSNYPETLLIGCDFTLQDKIIGMAEEWEKTVAELLRCGRGS